MKDLFANYSKEVRPVIDKEQPIPVNFDMMFSQLVELVCMAGRANTFFYGREAPIAKPLASQTKMNFWYSHSCILYSLYLKWNYR